jgi:hypothetical protein
MKFGNEKKNGELITQYIRALKDKYINLYIN